MSGCVSDSCFWFSNVGMSAVLKQYWIATGGQKDGTSEHHKHTPLCAEHHAVKTQKSTLTR